MWGQRSEVLAALGHSTVERLGSQGGAGRATQVPAGKAEGKPHLKSVFSNAEQSITGPAMSVWLVGQVNMK